MRDKYHKLTFLVLSCYLLTFCSSPEKCKEVGFEVHDSFLQQVPLDYCDCLKTAINKQNLSSFEDFALLEVGGGGTSYTHGTAVLK